MRRVPAKLAFSLVLLVGLSACSTALSPISEWEDGEDPFVDNPTPDTGLAPPRNDAGLPDAGRLPVSDATVLPPLPEAGLTDASIRRDAAVRDAALVLDTGVRDATVRDASPPDAAVTVDAGNVCAIRNAPDCPRNEMQAARCPTNTALRMCAYPTDNPRELSVYTCTSAPPDLYKWPAYMRVPCQRNCFGELPSAFEELVYDDCKSRPVLPCDSLVTNQLAVDFLLTQVATSCGMSTFHLGLIFSAEGCPRAIFGQEITDPAIKCIAKRLSGIRFGCTPLCAIAKTTP